MSGAAKLAQVAATQAVATRSRARDFYWEVCRVLPFVQRLHKLEEMASLRELRAIVKNKFNESKGVKDPRVSEVLIFKGREELECYLMMHKQRHHAVTEYIEPYAKSVNKAAVQAAQPVEKNSAFLKGFFESSYPQIPRKM